MEPPLIVRPDSCTVFGPESRVTFCLVTTATWVDRFVVEAPSDREVVVRAWEQGEGLAHVVASLPEPADVLVAAPGRLVTSPRPDQIGRRKLACFAAGSTPMPVESFGYFLDAFHRTDAAALERSADAFFTAAEAVEELEIVDERYGTTATFDPLRDHYAWNQQAGLLDWGEQQLAPAGELSVLTGDVMSFDDAGRLALDGELALRGTPIVHGGGAPYSLDDQERRYQALSCLETHAVILSVAQGEIIDHKATDAAAEPAADALTELFEEDARYRIVLELGFGINPWVDVQPGNRAMNEVHGGRFGVVHLGLGLTPVTTYAPIVLCPGSVLRARDGTVIVGRPARQLRRVKSASCGCR